MNKLQIKRLNKHGWQGALHIRLIKKGLAICAREYNG